MVRIAFVIGSYPPDEQARREAVALSYASPEVEIGIIRVGASPYVKDIGAAEIELAAPAFIDAYRRAQDEGYDAIVPLGFLDIGVNGGRSVVDIPIVGACQASLHVGLQLGDRLGLVVYSPDLIPVLRTIVRRYGMEQHVVGIAHSGFELMQIADNKAAMTERFLASARGLIDNAGAEVIIPAGITQCPIHLKADWLSQQLGVPVVEGFGAPIRMAALLAGLGLRHSRARWPASSAFKTSD
jgi:allantoin racemase